MDFSLSSSLVGSATLNPDKLALDLQFATDKTLTARRGPTPVFTRASTATHVGPNGLIGHAENLALYSEQFNFYTESGNIVYEGSNLATAPNGTLTADRIRFTGGTTGSLLRSSTGAFAGSKVITLWVKHVPTSDVVGAAFRLKFGDAVSSDFTATTQWQRFEFVTTDNASSFLGIVAPSTGSTETFDIWGIQYQRGTFSTEYLPTTTAAVYGARFDHDPITLACKGLLIEEGRTNIGLQSEAFETTTWDAGGLGVRNLTVTTNNITSPSGSTTADKLTVGATTTVYQVVQNTPTLTSGTVYSVSCYLKPDQVTRIAFYSGNTTTYPASVIFDLTGSGSIVLANAGTGSIQQLSNGWYRCMIVGTAGASASTTIRISPVSGTSTTYVGNSIDSFYAWGYQLEAGAFPTSYIPTTTASVVRSADICSITGANFTSFYNQSEGTVYTESRPATVNGTTTTFGLSNGTANERWLNRFAQNEQVVITSAGVEANLDALNPVAGTLYKVATAAKLNDIAMSINGLAVVTDTSQPMPVVDRAGIGNSTGTNTAGAVTIASLRYYKKRLANAKLQTLTA